MYLEKEDNYIIDKNRIDSVNKYIYTKFPTFDLHKKVKNYNNRISELMIENEKLKKYKSNLEKRIIRGNENFEVNFMKYELAISNALRIGYSCIFLCNTLNKIIDRYKIAVLRELLRRRDQFKNNLIKSYMNKNSYDKLFINSMVMKIEGVYERNRHFVTTVLVILVKNKLRDIFKLFVCNVLGIPTGGVYTFRGLSSGRENSNRVTSSRRGDGRYMELTTDERIKYTSGFIKLMDVLKIRVYGTVRVCFISLKRHNDEYDLYARGVWRSFPLSKRERTQFATNEGEAKKGEVQNCVRDKGNSRNGELFRGYAFLVGQKLIARGDTRDDDDRSNIECDRSSSSSYLPHPSDVYNYLYYQELLKIKDKLSARLMDDENGDLVNYKFMERNGEVYCLRGNGKDGGSSVGDATNRSSVIGNMPTQSWLPQSGGRPRTRENKMASRLDDQVGRVPTDPNVGFREREGGDVHRGRVVSFALSDRGGNPTVGSSFYEQKKRVGFNLRGRANYAGSEGLRGYAADGRFAANGGYAANGDYAADGDYTGAAARSEPYDVYEVENCTGEGNAKTLVPLSDMENNFRGIMSQVSEDNENAPEGEAGEEEDVDDVDDVDDAGEAGEASEEYTARELCETYSGSRNLCEQSIANITDGLSRIQEENFLCLVGEGPPDVLEVNARGQYYFGEDGGYGVGDEEGWTWGAPRKVLCAIRK
ncbi:conserved Plasmodium protein, unknown function [Plasmodium vivax]|nr:conserved Plasmodium protein, unknown function [Plasmodium vivax]